MTKKRFDDPLYNGTAYSLEDVEEIEAERGKPYLRLRKTVAELNRVKAALNARDDARRDGYAQAALTGIIARDGTYKAADMVDDCLELADTFMTLFAAEETFIEPEEIDDPEEA